MLRKILNEFNLILANHDFEKVMVHNQTTKECFRPNKRDLYDIQRVYNRIINYMKYK